MYHFHNLRYAVFSFLQTVCNFVEFVDDQPLPRKPPKDRSGPKSTPTKASAVSAPAADSDTPAYAHDHSYSYSCSCVAGCECKGCALKDSTIKNLLRRYEHDEELTAYSSNSSDPVLTTKSEDLCSRFLSSDDKVNTYTGLPSLAAFEDLLCLITPVASSMQYWRGSESHIPRKGNLKSKPGPARKLLIREELLLVLMKLRLALINDLLGDMFGVSSSSVSHIFNTYIKMLSTVLKPLIFWPHKQKIQEHLPKNMANYPNLRVTIDCTEVFIERPRHLDLQAQTWSDYKKHNTIKVLIGIAPNGSITFLSKAWGGRTSDKKITSDSGFLDLVDKGDLVMADRGFPIQEELLLCGAKLLIPPPSSGMEQMTRSNVLKTKQVANARIHVERAIGRMKRYSILTGTLQISLVPLVDDIFTVCAALCNLLPPLVH